MSSSTNSRIVATFVGILLALAFFSPVHAESIRTIHVDPIDDDEPAAGCTLREAIDVANAGLGAGAAPNGCAVSESGAGFPVAYNIDLPSYVYTLSGAAGEDGNVSGDLDLVANIGLIGMGTESTSIRGGGKDRVVDIPNSGFDVILSQVTIQDGRSFGGIRNNGSNLTVKDSAVKDNISADQSSGAIFIQGGTTTISATVVSNNASEKGGGGIVATSGNIIISRSYITNNTGNPRFTTGGIIVTGECKLEISGSLIANNLGGGIFAILSGNGILNIVTSSVVGNRNTSGLEGAGIFYRTSVASTNLNIANTSILSNVNAVIDPRRSDSGRGAGLYYDGRTDNGNLTNVTIANNHTVGVGAGIYVEAGTLNIKNTIVANNTADKNAPDCFGQPVSHQHNLIGSNTSCVSAFPAGR